MTFGLPCGPAPAPSGPLDSERLHKIACAAGQRLLADLESARPLAGDWHDRQQSDLLVAAALSVALHDLAATGCWGPDNRLAAGEFWRAAAPLLEKGVLQVHARTKPHGYAGDYQMLQWIESNYCCDDPLGQVFDRYFQLQAAPRAVRCRTRETAAALAAHCLRTPKNRYHVVSVGSGPASDLFCALSILPPACRNCVQATLLDLDPDALEFARQKLQPLLPRGALDCRRENLFRLPQRTSAGDQFPAADFLICSGLFDYLEAEAAAAMLRMFWQRLTAGGLLLVGNFAPHNPTRAYMEWIGAWYLIYRSPADLRQLAAQAGIPAECVTIASETLGVDLFLVARK